MRPRPASVELNPFRIHIRHTVRLLLRVVLFLDTRAMIGQRGINVVTGWYRFGNVFWPW
jgi:hypothetical protein